MSKKDEKGEMVEVGEMSEKGGRSEKNLNEKISRLDAKLEWFYSDEFKLTDAVSRYKDAMSLAKDIEKDLGELKNEIEVLTEDFSKS